MISLGSHSVSADATRRTVWGRTLARYSFPNHALRAAVAAGIVLSAGADGPPARGRSRPAVDPSLVRAQVPAADAPPPIPRPAAGAPAPAGAEPRVDVGTDGRITLHMDELDVRRALELISRQGGLNIMVSSGVQGRITANLEGATVDQALKAILRLGDLKARREEGLIYVYSAQDFKDQAAVDQPILTRIYRLNYIRSRDLMSMIADTLSVDGTMTSTPEPNEGINDSPTFTPNSGLTGGGGGGGGTAGGGGRGTSGGNSLSGGDVVLVRDHEARLRAVDEIVARLDIQPVQVLVEAVIVSVELTREREFGVNYSAVDNLGRALGTIGNGAELAANSGFTPAKLLTIPATLDAVGRAAAGRINGGAATGGLNSTTNGIKFGFVSKNNAGFVRALETLGDTKVLASPRLLVLNKQKAEIQLGQRLGYSTVTQNLTSTVQQVQFLNTGTLLRLRPFVSSDGMVRMEIHPERSSGAIGANNLPNSNTAEVTTNVMIPSGSTLVIGGLIENEDDFNYQGLPGVHRLPVLGSVLGFRARVKAKRELIVMLTPSIMKPGGEMFPAAGGPDAETLATPIEDPAGRDVRAVRDAAMTRAEPPTADPELRLASAVADDLGPAAPPRNTHVVRKGENFWTIARGQYGSGRHYLSLWYANRREVARPEGLRVGDEVVLPPVAELNRLLEVDPRTNRLLDGTPAAKAVDEMAPGPKRAASASRPGI